MTETRKFGGDAIQAVRTASQAQYHLSAMADRKASMMMGASFVVFTICVAQATSRGHLPLPLMVLGVSAFLAAVISATAVMPTIHAAKDLQGERNLMFFGGFADMKEDEYVTEMLGRLADQEKFLAMVARDVYQNGQVLAHKKYRLLKYAYSIFIIGLFASMAAFVATGIQ
ncbi:Pycsar system effector family protein [Sphingomonas sp.]|uniref:Pycsar system effector family protein n=1 Tax=Sphingomonas sp. TaxID=28214 RepID=UPI00286A5E73|nr:Pycsar system effector family protein [Sphingomonas sp.]